MGRMHDDDAKRAVSTDARSPTDEHVETSQPGQRAGFVYFIRCDDGNGHIKIGRAGDMRRRLHNLKDGCPYTLTVLAAVPREDPSYGEGQLHRQFSHLRVNGEWFRAGEDLLAFIDALLAKPENRYQP